MEMCLNCFILSSALLFSLFFCFSNYSRRLEDFPTSPTSTAKQEFLYVGSHVSLNPNCPDDPPIHLSGLSSVYSFTQRFCTRMSDPIFVCEATFPSPSPQIYAYLMILNGPCSLNDQPSAEVTFEHAALFSEIRMQKIHS